MGDIAVLAVIVHKVRLQTAWGYQETEWSRCCSWSDSSRCTSENRGEGGFLALGVPDHRKKRSIIILDIARMSDCLDLHVVAVAWQAGYCRAGQGRARQGRAGQDGSESSRILDRLEEVLAAFVHLTLPTPMHVHLLELPDGVGR